MARRELELREYDAVHVRKELLSPEDVEVIVEHHGRHLELEWPSPRSGGRYVLRPGGWAGYVPLPSGLGLRLNPKVEIGNLFRMLEYAYRLKSFELLSGLYDADSLDDIYERLAGIFARRVLDRMRRGLVREYVDRRQRLDALRGRLDLQRHLSAPWSESVPCAYQDHTADIAANRLLAWTLQVIARSGLCRREQVQRLVRRAYHGVAAAALPAPAKPSTIDEILYHRLNEDYRPLHQLCRFFLEQTGQSHEAGASRGLPFLVNLPNLFELFVAEWLHEHLPSAYTVDMQRRVPLGGDIAFNVDLVISEWSSRKPIAVIDTKYKAPSSPATSDIAQVAAYAEALGCRQAVLLYPRRLDRGHRLNVGSIHVRSLVFELDADLDASGRSFLRELALPCPRDDASSVRGRAQRAAPAPTESGAARGQRSTIA